MRLHLAGVSTFLAYSPNDVINTYVLETFLDLKNKKENEWIQNDYFILDSGAYTFMRGNKGDINWDLYIEEYAQFILTNSIKYYFELDIDKIVGLKEVEKLTDKLYQITNIKPIPVWHMERGIEYWDYMINNFPYVSISAAGNNFSSEWTRTKEGFNFIEKIINKALKKGIKVHGLGLTNIKAMNTLNMYSCDSTAWLFGNKMGNLFLYENGSIKKIKQQGKRLITKDAIIHNFKQWKKLQDYYLTK